MIGDSEKEGVGANELLARYVLRKEHIRKDGTAKSDPFMPYPHADLSVTRHIGLNDTRIWELGTDVAHQRKMTLLGRCDVQSIVFLAEKLRVTPDPIKENPNHANVSGWPEDKAKQKVIALRIVKSVTFLPRPQQQEE